MQNPTGTTPDTVAHSQLTRVIHGLFAIAIITQLLSSLVMHGPSDTSAGDTLFQLHRYAGFVTLGLAVSFWLVVASRRQGTSAGTLFPWFSAAGRQRLVADTVQHINALRDRRLPAYHDDSPLASAIHGLGLLLMSAMALTGTVYALQVWLGQGSPEPQGMLTMTLHFALANLVWAYLIGHASMGVLHHVVGSSSLATMWRWSR